MRQQADGRAEMDGKKKNFVEVAESKLVNCLIGSQIGF